MIEHSAPTGRLDYSGDLSPIVDEVCLAYAIGKPQDFSVIEIGYEDCNVTILTDSGKYLAKMFAKTRKPEEITRYTEIMQQVIQAGVNHPDLITANSGDAVYQTNGIQLVLMPFIEGSTFYEMSREPNTSELQAILEQAARINNVNYEPPYLFDSWAIPSIKASYERVKQYIKPEDLSLVEQVLAKYESIPVGDLPHCFVHGDLTKANVLKGDDGKIYILDFSVANWYPRIQELAVVAANLLHNSTTHIPLRDRCQQVANEYCKFGVLTDTERKQLYLYTIAGVAMEFLGGHQEKYINGNNTEETDYWINLGREGLRKELA